MYDLPLCHAEAHKLSEIKCGEMETEKEKGKLHNYL